MTPDQKHKEYYNADTLRGIKIGQEHSQPSPMTLNLIKTMEEQIEKINVKLDNALTIKDLENLETRMLLCNEKLVNDIFNKADGKYASKFIEKLLIYIGSSILVILIGAGMALLIKPSLL